MVGASYPAIFVMCLALLIPRILGFGLAFVILATLMVAADRAQDLAGRELDSQNVLSPDPGREQARSSECHRGA